MSGKRGAPRICLKRVSWWTARTSQLHRFLFTTNTCTIPANIIAYTALYTAFQRDISIHVAFFLATHSVRNSDIASMSNPAQDRTATESIDTPMESPEKLDKGKGKAPQPDAMEEDEEEESEEEGEGRTHCIRAVRSED